MRLRSLGIKIDDDTGTFGPSTRQAVRNFQQGREILADRNLTIQRFGKVRCTSRRAITYRLPLRKRERVKRVRATVNGKRVKVSRVARRGVRVSLRGRPKGRYRIRVTAKTSRKRTPEKLLRG